MIFIKNKVMIYELGQAFDEAVSVFFIRPKDDKKNEASK
jgi:hypothetical protein